MPLYDYRCASCGDFREFRPMTESRTPQACPDCGAPSARVLSAPFLAGTDSNGRTVNRGQAQARVPWRHACGFGCSHAHHGA